MTYGFIMNTPKVSWSSFNFVGSVSEALQKKVEFDTDINSAALGEWYWGAG